MLHEMQKEKEKYEQQLQKYASQPSSSQSQEETLKVLATQLSKQLLNEIKMSAPSKCGCGCGVFLIHS